MDTDQTDEELAAIYVANQDEAAFAMLLERYIEKVGRLAASILGPRLNSEVDDVVQEIFVRVHRGLASFRGQAKFSTWLFRIAYNQSITCRKRGLARLPEFHEEHKSAAVSRESDPSQLMDNAELRATLDLAIDRLPTEYQAVVRLYYWYEVPVADIAEQFGSPENTIKSWLFRARKLLAHSLEKESTLR